MPRPEISRPAGPLSRRRFIAIAGCAAGMALLPAGAAAAVPLQRWRGVALGADASIQLAHPDEAAARQMIARCIAEVRRLERIFSLYDEGSTLTRLNREGAVDRPPLDLVELLARARQFSELTGGAFDVTVQPLWDRYAAHFARPGADPAGPEVADVLDRVDWRALLIAPDRISFGRPGMAATLNGIAQGFITDRVAELLRRDGITQVLVDLGEIRAAGRHPDGRSWRAGIEDPLRPGTLVGTLELSESALATSGGYGTMFDDGERHSHLIDPRTGRTAAAARSISVLARDATTADALSTACALLDAPAISALLGRVPGVVGYLADREGLRRLDGG